MVIVVCYSYTPMPACVYIEFLWGEFKKCVSCVPIWLTVWEVRCVWQPLQTHRRRWESQFYLFFLLTITLVLYRIMGKLCLVPVVIFASALRAATIVPPNFRCLFKFRLFSRSMCCMRMVASNKKNHGEVIQRQNYDIKAHQMIRFNSHFRSMFMNINIDSIPITLYLFGSEILPRSTWPDKVTRHPCTTR